MTAEKLAQIVESLGGKYIAKVRVETLSGERFDFMAMTSGAAVDHRVQMDDGGPVMVSSFVRRVDGVDIEVVHRRPANMVELEAAL